MISIGFIQKQLLSTAQSNFAIGSLQPMMDVWNSHGSGECQNITLNGK